MLGALAYMYFFFVFFFFFFFCTYTSENTGVWHLSKIFGIQESWAWKYSFINNEWLVGPFKFWQQFIPLIVVLSILLTGWPKKLLTLSKAWAREELQLAQAAVQAA